MHGWPPTRRPCGRSASSIRLRIRRPAGRRIRRLLVERSAIEREKARLAGGRGCDGARLAAISWPATYGVDIDPAAVELTRRRVAARRRAPSSPGDAIRCGTASSRRISGRADGRPRSPDRVNAFDWRAAFPQVWPDGAGGGFDIVLGNPPFVKLQTLRGADPELAPGCRPTAARTPTRARGPGISISTCRLSSRACGCSRRTGGWPTSRPASGP